VDKIRITPLGKRTKITLENSLDYPISKKTTVILLQPDLAVAINPKTAGLYLFRKWGETFNPQMKLEGTNCGPAGIRRANDFTIWQISIRTGDAGQAGLADKQFQLLLEAMRSLYERNFKFTAKILTPADGSASG
jgi:hypothetical protein